MTNQAFGIGGLRIFKGTRMSYTIKIKCGNLLEEKGATFIVNASNTRMILGSGVSMAFKRHCGIELQALMYQELERKNEPLEQGDVLCTTTANATNFEYALHVAVMNYNKNVPTKEQKPTLLTIEKSLHNIEEYLKYYAIEHSVAIKLVLPLMGCGVGGLDKNGVIKSYFDFFSRQVDFDCEVVIYGFSIDDFVLIKAIQDTE